MTTQRRVAALLAVSAGVGLALYELNHLVRPRGWPETELLGDEAAGYNSLLTKMIFAGEWLCDLDERWWVLVAGAYVVHALMCMGLALLCWKTFSRRHTSWWLLSTASLLFFLAAFPLFSETGTICPQW